jgi:tRNA pseudouridine38-40 synthase
MRLKLTIEYAGTRYSGWQIQKNARTVQGELERAVLEATGIQEFELYGSGRTDAGVHALAQVAHLDISTGLAVDALRRRMNDALPPDIVVLRVERVRHRFHARHDAVARSYLYQVARRRTAFAKPFVWWVKEELSVEAMREAAHTFVGFHDFRAFSDDEPGEKSTEVLVDAFDLYEDEDLILFHIGGSHFIWKMVRRMVGVLVEVGRGVLAPADVQALLASDAGEAARLTAPASGLFLERVYYEGEPRDVPVRSIVTLRHE